MRTGKTNLLSLVVRGNPRKGQRHQLGGTQLSDYLWHRKHGSADAAGWHEEIPSQTNALKKIIHEDHLFFGLTRPRQRAVTTAHPYTHAPQCCGYNRNYRRVCAQCVSVCGHSFNHACHALRPPEHFIPPWAKRCLKGHDCIGVITTFGIKPNVRISGSLSVCLGA